VSDLVFIFTPPGVFLLALLIAVIVDKLTGRNGR
jgi:hypothetical protein